MLSGGTLFGEAILTVSLIALGGALTFLMAARLSASLSLGLLAAVAAISIGPRLYGYPKVFLFVLALACGWRYLPDRSTRRLFVMALVTAVAFLFRHDHGVYIGISMTGLIVLLDWGATSRAVSTFGRYLVFTALLLLPFGIFIQSTAGVVPYLRDSGPQMTELTTPVFVWPRFVAASEPVGSLSRPSEQRTHVRWADEVEDAVRLEREQRYALTKSARTDDVHTWSYELANNAPENIRALVGDPLVVDTNGVDRNASRIPTESWGERTMRRFHSFTRATLTQDNALAWLYYATLLLPVVGALLLLIGWRSSQITRDEVALVGSLVLLCAVIEVTLVRGSPDSRLPDVAAPMAVLGAWVTSRWLKPRDPVAPASRSTGRVLAAAIGWLITLWSCASLANAGSGPGSGGAVSRPSLDPGTARRDHANIAQSAHRCVGSARQHRRARIESLHLPMHRTNRSSAGRELSAGVELLQRTRVRRRPGLLAGGMARHDDRPAAHRRATRAPARARDDSG